MFSCYIGQDGLSGAALRPACHDMLQPMRKVSFSPWAPPSLLGAHCEEASQPGRVVLPGWLDSWHAASSAVGGMQVTVASTSAEARVRACRSGPLDTFDCH